MEAVAEQTIQTEMYLHDERQFPRKPSLLPIPKDKFKMGYALFFFMGMCHVLPLVFFGTANNFWLYKFRDPELGENVTSDAANRTSLQRYFASSSQIATTVPTLLFGVFNILVAYRYAITSRISVTLAIQSLIFILLTIFVEVDTDGYRELFFAIVMMSYVILSGTATVNMVGSMSLYSRFPRGYMLACIIGESVAAVVADVIEVICIAAFEDDLINSTLVFFIFGSVVLFATFCMSITISKTDFFQQCLKSVPQEKTQMPSRRQLVDVIKKLSSVIFVMVCYYVGVSATYTAITALVVSEETDTSWAKNYFSTVVSFLLGDFAYLVGQLLSSFLPIRMSEKVFLSFTLIRTVVLVPLVWLCNAQPRNHLPVVFEHDYQYGLIYCIFMITCGYVMNYCFLFIPDKVDKKEADVAYTVFGLLMNVISTAASPIGIFIVNIL